MQTAHSSTLPRPRSSVHLPRLALLMLLAIAWAWGVALGPAALQTYGWAPILLDYEITVVVAVAIFSAGFGWGSLLTPRRAPVMLPLQVALSTGSVIVGFVIVAAAIQAFLSLFVYGTSFVIVTFLNSSELAQANLSPSIKEHVTPWLVFGGELAVWGAGLVLVGALAGLVFRQAMQRRFPISVGILLAFLPLCLGIGLGLAGQFQSIETVQASLQQGIVLMAMACGMTLPWIVFEQARRLQRGRGQSFLWAGLATLLVTLPFMARYWGIHPILIIGIRGMVALGAIAPLLITLDLAVQHHWPKRLTLLMSVLAGIIPIAGWVGLQHVRPGFWQEEAIVKSIHPEALLSNTSRLRRENPIPDPDHNTVDQP